MEKNEQLLLSLSNDENLTFDSFYQTNDTQLLVKTIKHNIINETSDFVLLSGTHSTGKTHLLKASCLYAHQHKKTSLYLPLKELLQYDPNNVLSNLDEFWWLCIDDCDQIAQHHDWQVALFKLYNSRLERQLPICFSITPPVLFVAFTLADLKSRLSACLSFHMRSLNDEDKVQLLQFRALKCGMKMNDSCSHFIIQRSGRDLKALIRVIEKLDQATLKAGRKITIPFIKSLLGW